MGSSKQLICVAFFSLIICSLAHVKTVSPKASPKPAPAHGKPDAPKDLSKHNPAQIKPAAPKPAPKHAHAPAQHKPAAPKPAHKPAPAHIKPAAPKPAPKPTPAQIKPAAPKPAPMILTPAQDALVTKRCSKTTYPDLCKATLASFLSKESINVYEEIHMAIGETVKVTKASLVTVKKYEKLTGKAAKNPAHLKEYTDLVKAAFSELKAAQKLSPTTLAYRETDWPTVNMKLSAAMKYFETCKISSLGDELNQKADRLSKMTANALSFSTKVDSHVPAAPVKKASAPAPTKAHISVTPSASPKASAEPKNAVTGWCTRTSVPDFCQEKLGASLKQNDSVFVAIDVALAQSVKDTEAVLELEKKTPEVKKGSKGTVHYKEYTQSIERALGNLKGVQGAVKAKDWRSANTKLSAVMTDVKLAQSQPIGSDFPELIKKADSLHKITAVTLEFTGAVPGARA